MSYKAELQNNNVRLQGILDQVNALPDGGGGGLKYASGTWTPASDEQVMKVVGVGLTPKIITAMAQGTNDVLYDGKSKMLGGVYTPLLMAQAGTNTAGTGFSFRGHTINPGVTDVWPDDTILQAGYGVHRLESGFVIYQGGYKFAAGVTIKWEVWGE